MTINTSTLPFKFCDVLPGTIYWNLIKNGRQERHFLPRFSEMKIEHLNLFTELLVRQTVCSHGESESDVIHQISEWLYDKSARRQITDRDTGAFDLFPWSPSGLNYNRRRVSYIYELVSHKCFSFSLICQKG